MRPAPHRRILPAAMLPVLLWLAFTISPRAAQGGPVHHDLRVAIEPARHVIQVVDRITLDAETAHDPSFTLHRDLDPRSPDPGVRVEPLGGQGGILRRYRLRLPPGVRTLTLQYEGVIHHPLEGRGKEQARGFRDTPGLIAAEGVYLSGASGWVPAFRDGQGLRFHLDVSLPDGWTAVSQGVRPDAGGGAATTWVSDRPQQEIYLIAAPFVEYSGRAGRIRTLVFLREADEPLARRYLDAAAQYLAMYEKLLGEYPWGKFALVENFWETGFGMPSFTLLGPRVIRLPFILHSSYPHEILHNWWGNGVYVDYRQGNWSEGLTACLADHLIKEQRGQGAGYRQQALQKYADYAAENRDLPLRAFRGRHSSATEAVGYGKAMMVFHMLRGELGDGAFVQGLRRFYRVHRYREASWADLRGAFEAVSGRPLGGFFGQWVERAGAPRLALAGARVEEADGGYRLHFELRQEQEGEPYALRVPVAVTLAGREAAWQGAVVMTDRAQSFRIALPARPLRLDVDPEFDLFRRLSPGETPAAFSGLFGSRELLVVLPSDAEPGLLEAYRGFARAVRRMGPERVTVLPDSAVDALPADRAVMLLGWENRFRPAMAAALADRPVALGEDAVRLGGEELPRGGHAFALATRRRGAQTVPFSLVATDTPAALAGLARKLPHYHKYSYLAFAGAEPEIRVKGRWPVVASPMSITLGDAAVPRGVLADRKALAPPPGVFDADAMMETVRFLAGADLEGRGFGAAGLDRAAQFIAGRFREAGLQPAGDRPGSYFLAWSARGGEPEREVVLRNVVGTIPAARGAEGAGTLVIGAHYDHLGRGWPDVRAGNRGRIHPGADDNASGVAVLIELARVLAKGARPERNLVFVAFSGEEAGRLGSRRFVSGWSGEGSRITGMINLDTVGRLQGDPLLVLGAGSAREWPHIFRAIGHVTGIPVKMVAEELDASDQVSFAEAGIPAVQLFSGPNADYHRPGDTADRIDARGLVRVATVAQAAIEHLSSAGAALTPAGKGGGAAGGEAGKRRRVSLGTVPDFAYQGPGYRLSGVTPGGPAAAAGLAAGDVIVGLDGRSVHGLRDLSDVLKSLEAGDRIRIRLRRQDRILETEAVLDAK